MSDNGGGLFKKKRIGYGYSPNGVGGWLVVILIVAAVIAITVWLRHH